MQDQSQGLKALNKQRIFDEKARKWRQFHNKKFS